MLGSTVTTSLPLRLLFVLLEAGGALTEVIELARRWLLVRGSSESSFTRFVRFELVLDTDEVTDLAEDELSASFPGGGMLDASGEREREDFEVDEEWIERRLERRGSFGDIGGAMDTGECAIRRREGRRKGRGGGGRRSWCTCWCGQSGLSVLCPPLSSILYRRVNFRLSALVHLGTTFNTTQTLTTINSLPYPPQSSPVQPFSTPSLYVPSRFILSHTATRSD